jgi:hypothetical protein
MAATERRSGARTATRPSLGRALGLVALAWGVAVAFVLTVAADTRMGPVVFRFTATHGVHLGDIYATLACAVVAMLITVWIAVDHMGRKRRWVNAQRRAEREQRQAAEARYAGDEYDRAEYDGNEYDGEPYDDEAHDDEWGEQGYYVEDEPYDAEPAPGEHVDEHHDQHADPRRGRHEQDPDLVDTVFIRRPTDLDGRHRQRH